MRARGSTPTHANLSACTVTEQSLPPVMLIGEHVGWCPATLDNMTCPACESM